VREVTFASTVQVAQGLSAIEYIAIGLSSVVLALIYVASVSLYLHSRRTKRKSIEGANITLDGGRDGSAGLVKSNPLLAASRHFESDTNSGLTESDLGDDLPPSDNEQGFENVSAARAISFPIITPLLSGRVGSTRVQLTHQLRAPLICGIPSRRIPLLPAFTACWNTRAYRDFSALHDSLPSCRRSLYVAPAIDWLSNDVSSISRV